MNSSPDMQTRVQRFQDHEVGWEDASDLIALLKQMPHTTAYEPRVLPREWIHQILAAGRWSSSLYNTQPWYFIVIADRQAHRMFQEQVWEARRKFRRLRPWAAIFRKSLRDPGLKASLQKALHPEQVIFDHTVVIVSCVDPFKPEAAASTAMAMNNMALEATRLGMGCAFSSATQSLNLLKRARETYGVPDGYRFYLSLMVGFARRDEAVRKSPRKEVAEIAHWV